MSSEELHESAATLGAEALEYHRAIVSLVEELEAVDWYNQRAKATQDPDLRAILEHNRDEEKEHAAMALEWLRRRDPKFARHLRTYLFTEAPVTATEVAAQASDGAPPTPSTQGSLAVGSLLQAPDQTR
jgi:uncharacterized protein